MTWLTWALPLVTVVFLWTLNEFLRGRSKELISSVLAILVFGLVGLAFLVSGWKIGLIALVGAFVLGSLFRGPALALARRMLEFPDLGVDRHNQRELEGPMKTMRSGRGAEYFEERDRHTATHRQHTLDQAIKRPEVRAVLERFAAGPQDLAVLYDRVEIATLPPELRVPALCNPRLLEYFLANSDAGDVEGQYTRHVRNQSVHLTLTLWASSNPSGEDPT